MHVNNQPNLFQVRRKFGYIMISPAALTLFIMTIYPLIYIIVVSLHRWAIIPTIPRVFVGFGRYINMFNDSSFWDTLSATFIFTGSVVAVQLVLGFGLAMLVQSSNQKWLRMVFLLPSVVTPVVVGLVWRTLFSYDLGLINYFLSSLGFEPVNWLGTKANALISIILVDIWEWTPFAFLILLAGLDSLPLEPYESAIVDGASKLQILRFVTLPQLAPVITIVLMFRTLDAFKWFDTIYMITRGGPGNATELISFKIWQKAFFQNQLGYASALSVLTIIMATILMVILTRLMRQSQRRL